MVRFLSVLVCVLLLFNVASAQIGGNNTFEFLNLSPSARISGAGGHYISVVDNDVSLAYQNPAALNASMHNQLSVNSVLYPGKVNHGYVGFGRHYDEIGSFHTGLQYVAYGRFKSADDAGNITGDFSASEYALVTGGARKYDRYSLGTNLKVIYAQLESYNSFGAAVDLAATFEDTAKMFVASLVMKNIGYQFVPYIKGEREPLPFEIQVAASKRLKYLPFRLSILAHNLQKLNVRYDDPAEQIENDLLLNDTTGSVKEKKHIADKIARHFIISGEFYFGKFMRVALGYNHLRRQELAYENKKGLAGLSLGVGITIKKIQISYARAQYNSAGGVNHISVGLNLNDFTRKKVSADEG